MLTRYSAVQHERKDLSIFLKQWGLKAYLLLHGGNVNAKILVSGPMVVCVCLYLAGCTQGISTSAPISRVDGQSVSSARIGRGSAADNGIIYNRDYQSIPKGSYGGKTYKVKRGDTLFYIAWITGKDFRELADKNHLAKPWNLNPGQLIQLGSGTETTTAMDATVSGVPDPPLINRIQTPRIDSPPINAYPSKGNVTNLSSKKGVIVSNTTPVIASDNSVNVISDHGGPVKYWAWPASGKIVDGFLAAEGGNKGIDIAASRGQSIFATANGRIVYAGNALRGYGNLIIIKHNDDYLSAYAHNDSMLVREQQEVKAGQKIATMGSSGTSSVRLHFEIRYKGKSVNPLRYLPQR